MPGRASQLAQTSNEKVFLVAIHFLQVFALACEAVVQQRDKDPQSLMFLVLISLRERITAQEQCVLSDLLELTQILAP